MKRPLGVIAAVAVLGGMAGGGGGQKAQRGESTTEVRAALRRPPMVPPPIERTRPARVLVDLETTEERGTLAGGGEDTFWTFGGSVPGPMLRVREGDTG